MKTTASPRKPITPFGQHNRRAHPRNATTSAARQAIRGIEVEELDPSAALMLQEELGMPWPSTTDDADNNMGDEAFIHMLVRHE